jgi:crossover junction endodeoxyribonuclease RuvC
MVVLGVDIGIVVAGFGVTGITEAGKTVLLDYGVVRLSSQQPIPERLDTLYTFFESKMKAWGVTHLALETPFLGKNTQSFLKLGYVRGILNLLAWRCNASLREFSPREVKLTITGFGAADKEQLARIVARLFPGLGSVDRYDVTDAIALSLCGLWRRS